ncbi:CGNR zinc finger domain-containing protein [Streptosporangium sp. NPDC000396]|uniref:CGNR zinc finger domain-containing protein n=1 Tax=Streptosporangium sp. NPDC000396 TaxID=3366185 RepID=UPI0036B781CF
MRHSTREMADRAADLTAVLLASPTVESVSEVLHAYGEQPGDLGLTAEDVTAMRAVADRLREVFAAADVDEAAGLLNRLLAGVARPPRLTTHGGQAAWHLHVDGHDDAPWAEWFLASSAMALAVLLTDNQRVPGGICAAPGCGRPFVDSAGGSPQRFCSSRCATRVRVAGHRARRDAAPGGGSAGISPRGPAPARGAERTPGGGDAGIDP